jgi:hypothetical protein
MAEIFAALQSCLAQLDGFNKTSFFCQIAADRLLRKRIRVAASLEGSSASWCCCSGVRCTSISAV